MAQLNFQKELEFCFIFYCNWAIHSLRFLLNSVPFFPGMLLRWFIHLYDLEIVEEEAFMKWKEDLTDAYPGKGKALFQVIQ